MTTPIDALIAGEQAKIDLLRAKVAECERRITTLRAMQLDDDIDVVLARRLHGPVVPVSPVTLDSALPAAKSASQPKKTLSEATLKLLRFAEGADKSIDDFLAYAKQEGIAKDRPGMRAFLHQYKATYGLLDSDKPGHFRLNESGADFLKSRFTSLGGSTSAT